MSNSEKCVICGRDIPEGRQVCVICGDIPKKKVKTNYDRIRNMSVEEMAEFLRNFVTEALTNPKCIVVEKWLESEVQGNE